MKHQRWLTKHTEKLSGKTAVVTGANSGIGFEIAKALLFLGARVLRACRSKSRAEAARTRLLTELPEGEVAVRLLDLADFASIDAFAAALCESEEKIDIFVHCAGVYYPQVQQTKNGFPTTVGVNFVGTTRLAEAVLPLMNEDGRMVFVSSLVDRFGKRENPENGGEKEGYAAYAKSKLLLSAYVLEKAENRTAGEPRFIAVHPGITATDLLSPDKTSHKPLFSRLGHAFLYLFVHGAHKAALGAVLAAAGAVENGAYLAPRGIFGISGYPRRTRYCKNVKRLVLDKKTQKEK